MCATNTTSLSRYFYFFVLQDLLDEHAQSILVQIVNKVFVLLEYFGDNLGREHVLPVLSVFGTIGFIIAVGYLLAYLVRIEEEDLQKKQTTKNNNNNGKCPVFYHNVVLRMGSA